MAKLNSPPPSVPILFHIGIKLADIGALYEKMGFEWDAINSYLEALYSSPYAETGEKRGNPWLKISILEAQQAKVSTILKKGARSKGAANDCEAK